jgi:RHS repeat-associated protein
VVWPYFWSAFDRHRIRVWDNWQGSLLERKRDKTGLEYKRNRYCDPQTGRFTQEDPIGLAGGLNLYGFAAGDPVNFDDPFGLCPMCIAYAIFEVGSSLYDAYDLGKTAIAYARGQASKAELGVTAAGPRQGSGRSVVGLEGQVGRVSEPDPKCRYQHSRALRSDLRSLMRFPETACQVIGRASRSRMRW